MYDYLSLLGRFGGFNRSSIVEPYQLNAQKKYNISKEPKICISFEAYKDKLLEIDIASVSQIYFCFI